MTDSAVPAGAGEACFDFRSATLTLTVLELHYFEENAFEATIRDKIRQAPGFFKDLPLVIGLDRFQGAAADLDFFQIIGCCRRHSIQVVAVKGGDDDMRRLARNAALACLPSSDSNRTRSKDTAEPSGSEPAEVAAGETSSTAVDPDPSNAEQQPADAKAARVVTQPVRSGQQVYAPDGDLIIMAPVGAGAEVLAAGHIHIYGPLRGRALAGVLGDTQASVFCQSLEAELVSVAGHYKISEDLQNSCWREPARIRLRDDILTVEPLGRG